jgi:type IV pilus assembly protein PilC
MLFTGHLSTMLKSGVGVIEALDTLSHQKDDPNFGAVVHGMSQALSSGASLSHTFSLFPKVFPTLFVTMARVGENTGHITEALDSLREWTEKDEETTQKVKSAFSYPILVITVASILTMILFQTVIPKFMEIFDNLDVELPMITKFVLMLTTMAKNPGTYIILIGVGLSGWILLKRAWADPERAAQMTRAFMLIPVAGDLIQNASIARFANAAEMSMESGLDVILSVELGCLASGNPAMLLEQKGFIQALAEGETLSSHMVADPALWGTLLPQMVRAGEESAAVAPMLGRARDMYAERVDTTVTNLASILEPVLLLSVAIVVGVVLLSVFIPLYSVLGSLG